MIIFNFAIAFNPIDKYLSSNKKTNQQFAFTYKYLYNAI